MADAKKKSNKLTDEEVYNGFQNLRAEQRQIATKLSELEQELTEHKIVLDTLKDLDGDRRCFRLIGGVLCEKTVKDVIPTLTSNRDQLNTLITSLNEQLTKKGIEINEYKDKYDIQMQGNKSSAPPPKPESESGTRSAGVVVNPV
uniref:Prefoldin subunit 2 n=1 Tax=Cacopsylla melanoneura TaxID=428564 RepID=A0A8D8S1Q4_9HEMI